MTWRRDEFPARRTRCCTCWTRRPGKSSGRVATKSSRGTTGAASRWRTGGCTSPRSTITSIPMASRGSARLLLCQALLVWLASAQAADTEWRHKLLVDWGGLTHYGSENTELPKPKPGEDRVVFIG